MAAPDIPPEIRAAMGLRLKAARLALDRTQEQMAAELGQARNTYAQWETGTRKVDILALVRLLTIHRVTTDWVLAGALSGLPADLQARIFQAATDIGAPLGGEVVPVGTRPRGRPAAARRGPTGLAEGDARRRSHRD